MDISDGVVFLYTLGSKFTKGNYCIFIFRASIVCAIPMVVRTQEEHHHLLVHFTEELIALREIPSLPN